MPAEHLHLYRGTTHGWHGGESLRWLGITPTTEDPIVATLFALECCRFGAAVVLFCRRGMVESLIQPSNVLVDLEREVAIGVSPLDFATSYALRSVPAMDCRNVLAELGFELPPLIEDKHHLNLTLKSSPRMSRRQIEEFDRRCGLEG
jgi:hypothetical protein